MTMLVVIETRIFMDDAEYDHYVTGHNDNLSRDQQIELASTGLTMMKRTKNSVTVYRSSRVRDKQLQKMAS